MWCGRGDSNPHALASASPSSWCVCQFRHFRDEERSSEFYFGCGGGCGFGVLGCTGVCFTGAGAGVPLIIDPGPR
jgi:hypothetical protein